MKHAPLLVAVTLAALSLGGCWQTSDVVRTDALAEGAALPKRAGTVVVDGCGLDAWQDATLAAPQTRRVVQTVLFLCLVPRANGDVGPSDPSALGELGRVIAQLRARGYRVHLGVSFTDETGARYDGAQTGAFLADANLRGAWVAALGQRARLADGLEIDLQKLDNAARPSVTAFVGELSQVVRPAVKLGALLPPSVTTPSDLPGGDAFDVPLLAQRTDHFRIMTLDFSEQAPGPTIDTGWAVDAVKLAQKMAPGHPVDISFPLYGVDFGPKGPRGVSYLEARGLDAAMRGAPVERTAARTLHFAYQAATGEGHQVWYDDADSTGFALSLWSYEVLPAGVGVTFYGLGAEDPQLFAALAGRTP